MDEEGERVLPQEESLRLAALDFAMRLNLGNAKAILELAKIVYDFLKTGKAPEKDHDNASELQ